MGLKKDRQLLIKELRDMGIRDSNVLNAMERTKRELFIPKEFREQAYANYPLHIGHSQTISQPYTVAFMIELLGIQKGQKILEIGSGSGYNAAVMSNLAGKGKIISIERIKELADMAEKNLNKADIKNVKVIRTDGSKGYGKQAPYDRIIVTAAAPKIQDEWLEQLKNNGIIVAPIGRYSQTMLRITKENNKLIKENHGSFMFVPLITDD